MSKVLILGLAALGLVGCIAAPYHPSAALGQLGYSERHFDGNRWFVTYEASVGTLAMIGEARLDRRARELCGGTYKKLDPAFLQGDVPFLVRGCDTPGHVGCDTELYEAWVECVAP